MKDDFILDLTTVGGFMSVTDMSDREAVVLSFVYSAVCSEVMES
jgi:hypothetical protein